MAEYKRPGRNHLFVPGPTNIPDRVQRAMLVPSEDHRSVDFPSLTKPLFEETKKVFGSKEGTVILYPSSGTGIWESALSNTLSRGDKVLTSRFGQFSHLWIDMARRLGLDVIVQEEAWGTGADPAKIEEVLRADKNHEIKAVMTVHNETATGVTSDIGAVRKALDAAGHPALLFVDGISSIGSLPFKMDEWKVDCAIAGSQKGFMLPAGLGLICISPKALKIAEGGAGGSNDRLAHVYFAWADHLKQNPSGYFPYTPSLPLLYGLREALACISEEGLENVYHRHHVLAEATRQAVAAWGLKTCAKDPKWNSDTVTAIVVPEGVDAAKIIKHAYERYNLALGAGLSEVAGKVFRIGHLGDLNELSLLGAIAGAEMSMLDNGVKVTPGSGVAAASSYLRENPLRKA
ncbi:MULTISPECIES: aminotransferase class V-fold PLP-dependent enzyme [Methylobacterium]|uniref:Serine--glyoxylate aminotransferase n=7 Tax=Pseudomonadota TaxID=1224 RepID=A0ABQ4SXD5_9HYPH|nr:MULTISPECIES: aminotransferase class V-fold PLP-dependent enzyme [Methylobacterium]PIU07351.1 MAG: serine--glyoxylate aminotransferase [Methylobacterium sp. CG09_land_8_20_14_0_10_71_15]PIU11950.1 MAG: serine--glyoxylate aminotransferase [Methylobacterium sp. CG08_land_8_20_14_0_20_71_15]GBU16143.1 serine--glyoxylate aminotransferase [Methylobacterium sp.]GJE07138.1 Serine--glyoxylate aminotransferase [Methylobacterium jeotgali]